MKPSYQKTKYDKYGDRKDILITVKGKRNIGKRYSIQKVYPFKINSRTKGVSKTLEEVYELVQNDFKLKSIKTYR